MQLVLLIALVSMVNGVGEEVIVAISVSETRPCCCVSEVRIRAKPDQVLRSLPEASNDVSSSHIPMTFCDRQISVIVY